MASPLTAVSGRISIAWVRHRSSAQLTSFFPSMLLADPDGLNEFLPSPLIRGVPFARPEVIAARFGGPLLAEPMLGVAG